LLFALAAEGVVCWTFFHRVKSPKITIDLNNHKVPKRTHRIETHVTPHGLTPPHLSTNDSFSPNELLFCRITSSSSQSTIKKSQNETDSSLLLSSAYCFGRHQKDSSLGHAPEWCQVGHLEHSKEDDQFAVDSSNWFENWLQNGTFNGLAALRYEMSEDGPMQGAAELIHTSTILCTL